MKNAPAGSRWRDWISIAQQERIPWSARCGRTGPHTESSITSLTMIRSCWLAERLTSRAMISGSFVSIAVGRAVGRFGDRGGLRLLRMCRIDQAIQRVQQRAPLGDHLQRLGTHLLAIFHLLARGNVARRCLELAGTRAGRVQ